MKTSNEALISDLIERTRGVLNAAKHFQELDQQSLQAKPRPDAWNALECFEHLNRYGRFYLPEIRSRLKRNPKKKGSQFQSGILGDYFAKSMLPKEKLNKMTTFKSMNPHGDHPGLEAIDEFIDQQHQMLKLLDEARDKNLKRIKTNISISKWIKLRLGDTFRVVIYHNQRHILQAQKAAGILT